MRRELFVSLLLVAAVTAVYWPVHSYPFVLLDDQGYVAHNPYVRNGLTCEGVSHAFLGITVGNWHPVTMLSHMLDCQLFGAEEGAGWHHIVNLALHAANTVLLFILLRWMTGALWRSALVAALFGLHPLHVESVAWISERKDLLSTLFFMLTLMAYCHYVRRPTIFRYAAVFVLLALGLMSKPMLVTAPLVLLLLDYWPLGRMRVDGGWGVVDGGQGPVNGEMQEAQTAASPVPSPQPPAPSSFSFLIVEKLPLLILAAVSAAITYLVQQLSGAMGMLGQQATLGRRLGNAIFSCGQYLEKSFWPNPLAVIYPYVKRAPIDVLVVGLALAAISVAAIRLAKILPFFLVGWCWYLVTLVPVIGLVQVGVQSMADRYTYIPLIGIFIIAAWGAAEFTEGWPARNKAFAAAVVLAACGWCSWRQVATWSNSEVLYRHAVETQDHNIFAQHGLGTVYWKDGRLDEAQQQFEAILNIKTDPKLRVQGGLEPVHRSLGLLLAVRHQPKKALEQFDEAIQASPRQPEPLRHKAWLLATSLDNRVRDGKKAVECAEQAIKRSPWKPPEYLDTLAAAQAEAGRFKEAVESSQEALRQARAMRADDLIPGIEQRLKLFQSGVPYHAPAEHPQRL